MIHILAPCTRPLYKTLAKRQNSRSEKQGARGVSSIDLSVANCHAGQSLVGIRIVRTEGIGQW